MLLVQPSGKLWLNFTEDEAKQRQASNSRNEGGVAAEEDMSRYGESYKENRDVYRKGMRRDMLLAQLCDKYGPNGKQMKLQRLYSMTKRGMKFVLTGKDYIREPIE